jgi:diketogulonate reductase-like aldo/keto reductase
MSDKLVHAAPATSIRTTRLPSGEPVPVLGQGTWHLGDDPNRRSDEIAALRLGLDLGLRVIDTAELYGGGESERLVGEAIVGRRDDTFLVSKVLPQHATIRGTITACEASLRRLGTDHLDLYLLHWRGAVPLEETIDAFTALTRAGMIRYWGVSNFDLPDMQELMSLRHGREVTTDQVLYNLVWRGIEWDLLPWCQKRRLPLMAYSPIEQGRVLRHPTLQWIAARHGVTPAQVALAWVLRHEYVIAIPKAGTPEHVRANREALELQLTTEDLERLDDAFPPPVAPVPLEMH